jgi:hypothetical protein
MSRDLGGDPDGSGSITGTADAAPVVPVRRWHTEDPVSPPDDRPGRRESPGTAQRTDRPHLPLPGMPRLAYDHSSATGGLGDIRRR